jgi:hypothetical protein
MSTRSNYCITTIALCSFTLGIAAPEALAKPADNYMGIGVRGGLNDNTAVVINTKFKITDLGGVSLSGRPAIFFGKYTELRLALTGEGEIVPGWTPFFGVGVANNTDRNGQTNPMLAGGLDFQISERFVLQVGGNLIFQSNDTDKEFTATVNYSF